jgi:hypothetical protein
MVDFYLRGIGVIREEYYNQLNTGKSEAAKNIVVIIFSSANFLLFLLDCRLVTFHLYLIKSNITTYDYILKLKDRPLIDGVKKSHSKKKKTKVAPAPIKNVGGPNGKMT